MVASGLFNEVPARDAVASLSHRRAANKCGAAILPFDSGTALGGRRRSSAARPWPGRRSARSAEQAWPCSARRAADAPRSPPHGGPESMTKPLPELPPDQLQWQAADRLLPLKRPAHRQHQRPGAQVRGPARALRHQLIPHRRPGRAGASGRGTRRTVKPASDGPFRRQPPGRIRRTGGAGPARSADAPILVQPTPYKGCSRAPADRTILRALRQQPHWRPRWRPYRQGSRAGTATGDPHGTRLVLQRVSEPSAEYSCPPRQSADCDDGIYIVQFWIACRNARPCVATRRIRRCIRWQRFAPGAGSPAAGPSARSATGSVALFLSGRLPG